MDPVANITAAQRVFAALFEYRSVFAWESSTWGGAIPSSEAYRLENVSYIVSSGQAFAAVLGNGSVVCCGLVSGGGNSSLADFQLQDGVVEVWGTARAFAARTVGGEIVAWGEW